MMVLAGTAHADRAISITVEDQPACPERAAVEGELKKLSANARVVDAAGVPNVRVRVEDHGASYEVGIDGQTRTLDDPEKRCPERARTVALLAAMAIDYAAKEDVLAPPPPAPPVVVKAAPVEKRS